MKIEISSSKEKVETLTYKEMIKNEGVYKLAGDLLKDRRIVVIRLYGCFYQALIINKYNNGLSCDGRIINEDKNNPWVKDVLYIKTNDQVTITI